MKTGHGAGTTTSTERTDDQAHQVDRDMSRLQRTTRESPDGRYTIERWTFANPSKRDIRKIARPKSSYRKHGAKAYQPAKVQP